MTPEQVNALFRGHALNPFNAPHANNLHCTHGGSAPQLGADKGKPLAHKIENSEYAALLRIHARPVFEVSGDLEGVDMSKMQKIMTSGQDQVGVGLVFRQARWPHRMLQPEVPGFDKTPHSNLSFHMLMNGLLSKLLVETPAAKLDRELANKIMFAQFLVAMSFNYTHKQVLDTCQEMIMAWQIKEFEWNDWSLINSCLKNIRARFQQVPQPHVGPKTKDPKNPRPGVVGPLQGGNAEAYLWRMFCQECG